jgi:glycosyltransferase involved in cell wall biosynthesis
VIRCAVVPPVPVPYREPLFAALADADDLRLRVVYQSARQPGWDAPGSWFPDRHPYDAAHLRAWQRARPGQTPIIWPRRLERALGRFDADCVVVWEYGVASLRTLAWCRRRRRGYAIFSECTPAIEPLLSPRHLELQRWLALRADACIAASSAARERFLRMGVPAERVEVSVQSADVARLREIARPLQDAGASGDRPVRFLTVGRLVPDKNLARLIDAFAAAGLGAGRAQLTIHGIGPLKEELAARAAGVGVDVRFAGHAEPEALAAAYGAADAFVLASTFEPFGVVVREAAAAALPIVCSRVAGAAGDVAVEGENALLVDPFDVDDLAGALRRLADEPALRAALGARGRALEERVTRDGVAAFARAAVAAAARAGRPAPGR